MVYERFAHKLHQRKSMGNYRELRSAFHLIDFASNDYLGFARSDELKREILQEWESLSLQYACTGFGSTGSRLLTGHHPYCEELEKAIAHFHGAAEGLIFNTGYMANSGLLAAIADPEDTILFDAQIHASMRDGIQRSKARSYPFRHNDANHLEERLKNTRKNVFVCIESLYSIDGAIAPCNAIGELCQKYGAHLIVDEAHATGIIGENGEGLVHALGMQEQVFARVHTFGKALGVHGAIVLGNKLLKDYLINFSIPFIYTTCLPLHSLAAIKCAYQKLPLAAQERTRLLQLEHYFGKSSPIIPLVIGGNARTKAAAQTLAFLGYDIRPILSPTARKGEECLRLCLHEFNTLEEVAFLVDWIKKEDLCASLPSQE